MSGFFTDSIVPATLATPAQLATYMGTDAPTNATVLLREATRLVLAATIGAYYNTDPTTGLSTEPLVAASLTEATCAQAAAWDALKYNPLLGGVVTAKTASQKSILTAHITYADAGAAAASRAAALNGLVPSAYRILAERNLLATDVLGLG